MLSSIDTHFTGTFTLLLFRPLLNLLRLVVMWRHLSQPLWLDRRTLLTHSLLVLVSS